MSYNNYNNRSRESLLIGAISASKRVVALVAAKKMRVHGFSVVDTTALAAHADNHLSYVLYVNNVVVGTAVTTLAGVAARVPVDLDLDNATTELDLEEGDVLELAIVKVGTGAGTMLTANADLEVLGS